MIGRSAQSSRNAEAALEALRISGPAKSKNGDYRLYVRIGDKYVHERTLKLLQKHRLVSMTRTPNGVVWEAR